MCNYNNKPDLFINTLLFAAQALLEKMYLK